jgi:hypothetical protein
VSIAGSGAKDRCGSDRYEDCLSEAQEVCRLKVFAFARPIANAEKMLPRPKPTVVFREMPEGAILFCTATEVYFSLNSVGVQVWRLLHPVCSTESEVVRSLAKQHPDASSEEIAADVSQLIRELLENALVEAPAA